MIDRDSERQGGKGGKQRARYQKDLPDTSGDTWEKVI
jgi:hypothetical protein